MKEREGMNGRERTGKMEGKERTEGNELERWKEKTRKEGTGAGQGQGQGQKGKWGH
jgi:hypothetical protein